MAIYDINGNEVSSLGSSVEIEGTSFLSHGNDVTGNTYGGLSSDYVAMAQSNYSAMMAECKGDYTKIPIIVSTDQHARSVASVFNMCDDMVDWYEISKVINLGDTCSGTFSETQLEAYRNNMESFVPLAKRIEVYGNHDVWDADENQKYTVNQKRLSPFFYNVDARRHGNNGYFTVIDDRYNVKYLIVNNYEYPETNFSTRRITTAQADFIVRELSAQDGRDIILCAHQPLTTDGWTSRDETYTEYSETFLSDSTVNASFLAMLKARKNHTSGSFTDSEGVAHAYDFTNTESELLCSLHGHAHFEACATLEDSLTEFVFDWFPDNTFYFAYIDRLNKKMKVWKNEIGVEALEISI